MSSDLFLDLQPALAVASYVRKRAEECAAFIRLKQPWFQLTVKIDASGARRGSNGGIRKGKPHISIATSLMIWMYRTGARHDFTEYASVANLPDIGTFRNATWQEYADCLVAHEVAHAYMWSFQAGKLNDHHGPNWQRTYRILRNFIFNTPRS